MRIFIDRDLWALDESNLCGSVTEVLFPEVAPARCRSSYFRRQAGTGRNRVAVGVALDPGRVSCPRSFGGHPGPPAQGASSRRTLQQGRSEESQLRARPSASWALVSSDG